MTKTYTIQSKTPLNKGIKVALLAAALAAALPASAALSAITSASDLGNKYNANGVVIWFNSVMRPIGVPLNQAVTICVTQQVISVPHGTETELVEVPDSVITFKPWETQSHTSFPASSWEVGAPSAQAARNTFMSGESLPFLDSVRDIRPMTWTGRFSSDLPGVSVQWQWGAAAYSQFSENNSELNVATGERTSSEAAGTPVAMKPFVIGSVTDGNRFVGLKSATANVVAEVTGLCGGVY
jgi:hypothetical protein